MKQRECILACFGILFVVISSRYLLIGSLGIKKSITDSSNNLQELEWYKTYGGIDTDRANALIQTTDKGFILAGWTTSFGDGEPDMWVVKTDVNGTAQWTKTYGGLGWEYANSLVKTNDEGFALVGSNNPQDNISERDIWLVKIDEDGEEQWNKTFSREGLDYTNTIIQTADGGYVMAGSTEVASTNDIGGLTFLNSDIWLIKTDSDGKMIWNKTYGNREMWDDEHAYALVQTADGGFVIAGSISKYERFETDSDMWLVKTNADGEEQWNRTYGGDKHAGAKHLVHADGGFVLAGYSDMDMWLVRTDSNGNELWNNTYGERNEIFYGTGDIDALAGSQDGGFVFATTYTAGAGQYCDTWFMKTDENGILEWTESYGGMRADFVEAIIQTTDGGYALTGSTNSYGIDKYDSDMWLVKTKPSPVKSETTGGTVIHMLIGAGILTLWYRRKKRVQTE